MTMQILRLLALHVVISCMMSRLKWSKLQEYLSLHRLLDTFPNMIVGDIKCRPTGRS